MAGLVPFNWRNNNLVPLGFDDFHNMMDDFFSDRWASNRNLLKDSFKIDIRETEEDYLIEAEMPGISKDEININADAQNLCISVVQEEKANADSGNYIHRERRTSSATRRIHLANAELDQIRAKLEHGVLTISIPKRKMAKNTHRIEIE